MARTGARPNILWICTDSQRPDTIGALGNPHIRTPTLDRLAEGGVAFTRAYAQSPMCTPSRSSFLTGTYPSAVHACRNGVPQFSDRFPLVTRLLADVGYDCALVGKLHLASAYGQVEPRVDDGYRYWRYSHAPRDDWAEGHDYADWVTGHGTTLAELIKDPNGVPTELHQTTWCAHQAINFIREQRDGPWLASVNIYDPHPPFNPPLSYRRRYDPKTLPGPAYRDSDLAQQERLAAVDFQSRARPPEELDMASPVLPRTPRPGGVWEDPAPASDAPAFLEARDARTLKAAYYAMIEQIDDQVQRMLEAVEEAGQLDDTLVVFMSDHGEALGDHGLIQKGCRFYDNAVRVPLILSWPGRFQAGLRSPALVELTDLAPTFLDAAGIEAPHWIQGRSLLPLLTGAAPSEHHRDFVRSEYYDAVDMPDNTHATMYRDDRYKLVVYHGHDLGELYDMQVDPDEHDNLWDVPDRQALKNELLLRSFDATVFAVDHGEPRVGPI